MKPPVLITFDSMKYPNTGLYSFGKSLGDEILEVNKGRFNINYYVHPRSPYTFNNRAKLIYLSVLHKLFFPLRSRFKLVHFTDQYCRLRPFRVKAVKVLTIHDLNPVHEGFRSPASLNKYLNRLGGYIDACDKIVAISQFVASDIEKYFPEAKNKITVIYNGADKSFVPAEHKPVYDPQEKFLFAIGHVSAKKNFHVLPALLAGNNYKLVISGILTDYQDKIIQEAEKFNCTDRVIITGPVNDEDKVWYYKNCEAFVFPSLAEGFGLPVIEAMHFGKPVFLSTSTSLPEVGGDVAYYFNSFEPEKMQQVLREGLQDFYLNQRTAAIKKHAEKFSWKKTAEQYLNLYQQCLK